MDERATVQTATELELRELVRLNQLVQDLHFEAHPAVFRRTLGAGISEFFRQRIRSAEDFVLLARYQGAAVGYLWANIQARPATPFANETRRIYLHQVGVDPAHRRRGIGRTLFRALEESASKVAISEFALDTWSFNQSAHSFFKSLGFSDYNVRMWRSESE